MITQGRLRPFSRSITRDVARVPGVQTVAPVRWYAAAAGASSPAWVPVVVRRDAHLPAPGLGQLNIRTADASVSA